MDEKPRKSSLGPRMPELTLRPTLQLASSRDSAPRLQFGLASLFRLMLVVALAIPLGALAARDADRISRKMLDQNVTCQSLSHPIGRRSRKARSLDRREYQRLLRTFPPCNKAPSPGRSLSHTRAPLELPSRPINQQRLCFFQLPYPHSTHHAQKKAARLSAACGTRPDITRTTIPRLFSLAERGLPVAVGFTHGT